MGQSHHLKQLKQDLSQSYENRHLNTKQTIHPAGVVLQDVPERLQHIPVYFKKPVHQWMKINPEAFPSADQLEESDLQELCFRLRILFYAYHYEVIIPYTLSFPEEYTFLVQAMSLEESNHLMEEGRREYLHLCKREEATCPFGEECVHGGDGHCGSNVDSDGKGWLRYV